MKYTLSAIEKEALKWLFNQSDPVYSFGNKDPNILVIKQLVTKKLAKVAKVIKHPNNEFISVTCFAITRKGKRYVRNIY